MLRNSSKFVQYARLILTYVLIKLTNSIYIYHTRASSNNANLQIRRNNAYTFQRYVKTTSHLDTRVHIEN